MEAAIAKAREEGWLRVQGLTEQYGQALRQTNALQVEMSAWVLNKADSITPEQMADMFYQQDSRWQAAFFNCMQDRAQAHHDALPKNPHGLQFHPGVPAGESQWWHMAESLNSSGFETLEAMFDHAKHHRERTAEQVSS
jgi:hypothetical protein